MDLVEKSTPVLNELSAEAKALSVDWQRFMRREVAVEEFRELAQRVDGFLARSEQSSCAVADNLQGILLAQDYQDLTGQVIKRVTQMVTEVEGNLLKLVLMASQVDRFAGIEHDREQLRAEKDREKHAARGEGPQIHADKREDVVSGQDDVDDLLSSLGF
ncbi:chemotaxis regulator CheZ [compost metagenome]